MNRHSLLLLVFVLAAARLAAAVAPSAAEARPLAAGAAVPDVTVRTADGQPFALRTETAKQPALLVFYRGGWCPFCTRHLAKLQEAQPELKTLGYRILAISADPPAALKPAADKHQLTYTLLSDSERRAADAFGLSFRLDDETAKKYQGYRLPLNPTGDGGFWLPVPAVYLVGRDGRIAFAHSDPDYTKRLPVEDLLKAARAAR
jgi:peroxiredoxin